MSNFMDVLDSYVNTLKNKVNTATRMVESKPSEDSSTDVTSDIQHLNLFRGVGELQEALEGCNSFQRENATLSTLVSVAQEIASANNEVLCKLERLAIDSGKITDPLPTNGCVDISPRELQTPLNKEKLSSRTPLAEVSNTPSNVILFSKRKSDPPTPSLEDIQLSQSSMAMLNSNDDGVHTPRIRASIGQPHKKSTTKKKLWLTPVARKPQPPIPSKYLPDLVGEDDSDCDSVDEAPTSALPMASDNISHTVNLEPINAKDLEQVIPAFMKAKVTQESVNAVISELNHTRVPELFSQLEFEKLMHFEQNESKMMLLALVKLKKIKLLTRDTYSLCV